MHEGSPGGVTRRRFLRTLAGTAASLALAPCAAWASLPEADAWDRFLPEYAGDLSEALIVFDQIEGAHLFHEVVSLLRHFPPGARLHVLASPARAGAARERIAAVGLAAPEAGGGASAGLPRADVTVIDDPDLWGDWGRDISMLAWPGGRPTLVVPYHKAATERAALTRGYEVLRALARKGEAGLAVAQAPLSFEGGNVTYDRVDGERVLFTGNSAFLDTRDLDQAWFGVTPGEAEVSERFRRAFGVDRVVALGRRDSGSPVRQASLLFHLDMAMVVLGPQLAGVARFEFGEADRATLLDVIREEQDAVRADDALRRRAEAALRGSGAPDSLPDNAREARDLADRTLAAEFERLAAARDELAAIRAQLTALGYTLHDVPTDWRHVRRSQAYTNVLLSRDRIIMPVFPEVEGLVARSLPMPGGRNVIEVFAGARETRYAMTGLNLANYEGYAKFGRGVRVVEDRFYLASGNVHCVIGRMA